MKKILMSLMVIALVAVAVAGATGAWFSDTETSSGNTFQAGTIDLAVNNQNPWSQSWEFIEIKPCLDLAPMVLAFKNVGNNEGVLTFGAAYVEKDKYGETEPLLVDFEFTSNGNAAMELSADQFAAILYVAAVTQQYTYEGYVGGIHDDLPNWMAMDANGDGYLSLYELKAAGPIPWATDEGDTLPAGHCTTFTITWHLADSLTNWGTITSAIITGVMDNAPQADGIEMTITATLTQVQ